MRVRILGCLFYKDLLLHWKGVAGVTLSIVLAIYLAGIVAADGSRASEPTALIFNLNLLASLFWGEWLVGREKTKGTLHWLRSMPISELELVASKALAAWACTAGLWLLSSGIFLVQTPAQRTSRTLFLLFVATMSVCSRLRFPQKLGQLAPVIALMVPVAALVVLGRTTGVERPWPALPGESGSAMWWAFAAGLGLGIVALIGATSAWIQASDSTALRE